jgi:[glutamine synthetase] adenylyltransferase / [glutamine synthetase]-adenylyl-L-tyrosine phosphorylase
MVQYLVLAHAAQYPQLTENIGNIGLLKLCGALGLIDSNAAAAVADAYRTLRKLQHQLRLQGEDKARIEPERVATAAAQVKRLWQAVFVGV